ncbi:MAG: 50S ribosomal protein L19 [Patescibacteria group bacterium]|nr:50S ribosomal protein L19 [Patescibacteria group bacterium]
MDERKNLDIRSGDVVRVHQKIQEKGKTRIQIFEGLVLARKHGTEAGATFTVRATLSGIGVEKIFPLYSPLIDKIEIVRRSKVRRSKLYYIRDKASREQRRQLRRMTQVSLSTVSEKEQAETEAARVKAEEEKAAAEAAAKAEAEANAKAEAEAKAAAEAVKAEAAPEPANDNAEEATPEETKEAA